jgi:hypothetical protein
LKDIKVNSNRFSIILAPLALSFFILFVCYPGFMSYDSVRMLEESRSTVRGGIYPAAPVYILRLFDLTGFGVPLMLQFQNFTILFSIAIMLRLMGVNLFLIAIALVVFLISPTIIGCMLVLWKDVTITSMLILSIALIFRASCIQKKKDNLNWIKWISLILLIISTSVRFNAITATAVIALYWLHVFFSRYNFKMKLISFVVVIFAMILGNNILNTRGFPDFRKLESNPLAYLIMSYDLVGISSWSRVSLIPIESVKSELLPKAPISDIDKIYSSLGALEIASRNSYYDNKVNLYPVNYTNNDILIAWFGAIKEYPFAYLRYRWDLFSEIIGFKCHATFEPTHFNKIDENPFNIKFKDRELTNIMLIYIKEASGFFWGKPWFFLLIALLSALSVNYQKGIRYEFLLLSKYSFVASIFYIMPFFIISGTGEVRYAFPAMVLSCISILICVFNKFRLVLR